MNKDWRTRLTSPEDRSRIQDFVDLMERFEKDHSNMLNKLMIAVSGSCRLLEFLVVKGYSPLGIHVKGPNPYRDRYPVAMEVIPQMEKGLLVRVRKFISDDWEMKNIEGQRWWVRIVENDQAIEEVVSYCREVEKAY